MRGAETEQSPGSDSSSPPESVASGHSHYPRIRLRFVFTAAAVIAAFFSVVGLILYFKPFTDPEPAGEPALDVFAAGPVESYEPASVTYFENEHFYLVRLQDGAFLALYDLGPLTQSRVVSGGEEHLSCRIEVHDGPDMAEWLARSRPVPGFDGTGFYSTCDGTAWKITGEHVWGAGSGDLDRFPVRTVDGIVRVNLGERRCLNEIGPESPCIRTQ